MESTNNFYYNKITAAQFFFYFSRNGKIYPISVYYTPSLVLGTVFFFSLREKILTPMRMFYKLITLSQRQHVDNKKKNSISMMIEGVGAGGSVASYLKFIFYVFSIAHVIFFPWKKLDRAVL